MSLLPVKPSCCLCHLPPTWIRYHDGIGTQNVFCDEHAKKQEDFGVLDVEVTWGIIPLEEKSPLPVKRLEWA